MNNFSIASILGGDGNPAGALPLIRLPMLPHNFWASLGNNSEQRPSTSTSSDIPSPIGNELNLASKAFSSLLPFFGGAFLQQRRTSVASTIENGPDDGSGSAVDEQQFTSLLQPRLPDEVGGGSASADQLLRNMTLAAMQQQQPIAEASMIAQQQQQALQSIMFAMLGNANSNDSFIPALQQIIAASAMLQQPSTSTVSPDSAASFLNIMRSIQQQPAGRSGSNANAMAALASRRTVVRRAVFSDDQRRQLERTFQRSRYISRAERKKLAEELALKEVQVKIWFQNRRMKWRTTATSNSNRRASFSTVVSRPMMQPTMTALPTSLSLSSFMAAAAAAAAAAAGQGMGVGGTTATGTETAAGPTFSPSVSSCSNSKV